MTKLFVLFGVILAWPALAGAQYFPSEIRFVDTNRLALGQGDTRLEATIGNDLHLLKTPRFFGLADFLGLRTDVYGSALVRLRMSNRRSSPIRTPSFEPRASVQFSKSWSTSALILDIVPLGHHSNGQEECALKRQVRKLDENNMLGECIDDPGNSDPMNSELNLKNGSFSTNYTRIGAYYRKHNNSDQCDCKHTELTAGLEFERHYVDSALPGDLSEELSRRYGRKRTSFNIRYRQGRVEARYWFQRIAGIRVATEDQCAGCEKPVAPKAHIAEAVIYLDREREVGTYTRYYNGRDYYNINFEQDLERIEIGFVFDW